ncbi:MAG: hypothetical protein KAR22_26695 [Gammaproteobacteria bacterium]|nr:hypothetical protein [Gammaproteobacteria bacterium]
MKFHLTVVAMALSVLAAGPVFAGGAAGGCDYSGNRYTAAEPQEQSEAAKKLASLSVSITEQETAASVPETSDASPADQKTTAQ